MVMSASITTVRVDVPSAPWETGPWETGPWETLPSEAGATGPLILALDTASAVGGVALCRGPHVLGEETWHAGGQQTAQILPAAARLWERAGVTARDVQGIAVGTGPGSYTGLRVGLSLGKGFALALRIPLVGVPTLDAVAYQHREAGSVLCAVVDAGRGQYYTAFYRSGHGVPHGGARSELQRLGEYAVVTAEELAEHVMAAGPGVYVGGELNTALVGLLASRAGAAWRCATPSAALRRPAFLAEIARGRLSAISPTDAETLQPLYLRRTP